MNCTDTQRHICSYLNTEELLNTSTVSVSWARHASLEGFERLSDDPERAHASETCALTIHKSFSALARKKDFFQLGASSCYVSGTKSFKLNAGYVRFSAEGMELYRNHALTYAQKKKNRRPPELAQSSMQAWRLLVLAVEVEMKKLVIFLPRSKSMSLEIHSPKILRYHLKQCLREKLPIFER